MKQAGAFIVLMAAVAAAPASAQQQPLRTVVYGFTYDSRGFNATPSMSDGKVADGQSAGSEGRTGRIKVDVIQAAADGGLVVDVTETVDRDVTPPQTIRCAAYGSTGDVICDQNADATDEERTLLTYVGRFFYDPSKVDAGGHWQSKPAIKSGVDIVNHYTVTKTDGSLLTIAVDRKEDGLGYMASTTGTIVYDSAMEIPRSIHLDDSSINSGNQGDMDVRLTMLSDSMVAGTSQTPH